MFFFKKQTNIKYPEKYFEPSNKFLHEPIEKNIKSSPNLCMYEAKKLEICLREGGDCFKLMGELIKCVEK